MSQGVLFPEPSPPCRFGSVAWTGRDHCAACHAAVEAAVTAFALAVQAGTYDAAGYTPHERKRAQVPA